VSGPEIQAGTLFDRTGLLFASFQGGDRPAFDELVTALTPLLWHTVRSQGADRVTAEDVVQTVWMELLRHADAVREPRAVAGWLVTAAKREVWRVLKKQSAVRVDADPEFELISTIPAPRGDEPDEQVVRDDRDTVLWSAMQSLSSRCQHLLRVVAFCDRPDYEAISLALGIPKGSIGPTRGRCLAKLREQLSASTAWEG
jgi:RNA polymerase sigma factor (sigma-70 family)